MVQPGLAGGVNSILYAITSVALAPTVSNQLRALRGHLTTLWCGGSPHPRLPSASHALTAISIASVIAVTSMPASPRSRQGTSLPRQPRVCCCLCALGVVFRLSSFGMLLIPCGPRSSLARARNAPMVLLAHSLRSIAPVRPGVSLALSMYVGARTSIACALSARSSPLPRLRCTTRSLRAHPRSWWATLASILCLIAVSTRWLKAGPREWVAWW